MVRPRTIYHQAIQDFIQELRITANELERGIAEKKSPEELLNDLKRRNTIHSGLTLRTVRKLREIVKKGS